MDDLKAFLKELPIEALKVYLAGVFFALGVYSSIGAINAFI